MTPRRLSRDLRKSDHPHLRRRRGLLGLALTAAGSMAAITLYQMGVIRHLPEPPIKGLDADKVDASDEAYQYVQTPDAALGLLSYAATAALVCAASSRRAEDRPWVPVAMAGKIAFDVIGSAKLTYDQWAKHRAFCSWCLLAAGATFAMVPLAAPETRAAVRTIRGRGDRRVGERMDEIQRERGELRAELGLPAEVGGVKGVYAVQGGVSFCRYG